MLNFLALQTIIEEAISENYRQRQAVCRALLGEHGAVLFV